MWLPLWALSSHQNLSSKSLSFPTFKAQDHSWLHASTAHHRTEQCPHVPRSGHSLPCKPSSLTFFSCKSLFFNSNMCWQLYPSLIIMFGLISVTNVHQYLLSCKTPQVQVVMKLAGNDFIIPFRWWIKYWILLQSNLKGMLPVLPWQTEKLPISKEVARSTSGYWKPTVLARGVDVYTMGLCLCQRRPWLQVKCLILSQPEVSSRTGLCVRQECHTQSLTVTQHWLVETGQWLQGATDALADSNSWGVAEQTMDISTFESMQWDLRLLPRTAPCSWSLLTPGSMQDLDRRAVQAMRIFLALQLDTSRILKNTFPHASLK